LMDGIVLRESLSQQRNQALIPFIFLSSNDSPSMLKQAAEMGVDDYLNKPVNKAQLTQCINRVIKRSQQVHQQITDRIDQRISSVLKPDLPILSQDWKLAVASRNTGSGGGDLLLHHISDKNTVLMLSDIMGHDDSAKFFSYAYAGYLHGLLHGTQQDFTPAGLLEELSENALQEKLLSKVLLTCCVVTLSKLGRLTVASAGHPTPIHINKSGINHLDVGGVLPGLVSRTRYDDLDITIKQGERVALYTDGLFESAYDEKSRHHLEETLCHLLSSTLEESLDVSLSIVMERFDQLTSYEAKDDVTLILLEPI
jgi:sigma-B regulation protein RsbU (phosphoserine phosphatase)